MCKEMIEAQQRRAAKVEQQPKAAEQSKVEPKVELQLPDHKKLVEEAKVFLKETVAEGASDVQLSVDAEQLAAATEAGDTEAQTQIIEQVLARELMLQGLEIPV